MKPEVKEVLVNARKLIEYNWTQGAVARDRNGIPIAECSPDADTFCSAGAIYRAAGDNQYTGDLAFAELHKYLTPGRSCTNGITYYNDTHSHEEVLALFDKAIGDN